MNKTSEDMKKINLDDLDHVVGGENGASPDLKIDFGDLEISVELKKRSHRGRPKRRRCKKAQRWFG